MSNRSGLSLSGRRALLALRCVLAVILAVAWCLGPAVADPRREKAGADSVREQVEADWLRQDQRRIAQIRQPGLVRFVEGEVEWAGARAADRLHVPEGAAPKMDGRLDEPVWQGAARVAATSPEEPSLWLAHNGERLFVGITLPTAAEPRFQGVSTAIDAAGAVDGVKNGLYAFHTGREPNPWWEVDLGSPQPIGRVVVFNRLDYQPGLHNADNLRILISNDRKQWTQAYDNRGKHFGGATNGKPLVVDFTQQARSTQQAKNTRDSENTRPTKSKRADMTARFVRLQIPSVRGIFFHLDEVEIYGPDASRNLALGQPARQSSLSRWSKGCPQGAPLVALGSVEVRLEKDNPAGLVIDGESGPSDGSCVLREGGRTSIELSLPLGEFPGPFPDMLRVGGRTIAVTRGGPWRLRVPRNVSFGYGKNRIELGIEARQPLEPPVSLRAELAVFTPFRLEQTVVLEQTLDGAQAVPLEFDVAQEGAAALIVTATQGSRSVRDARVFFVEPVLETLRRAERLLDEFGVDVPGSLGALRRRAVELAAREREGGSDPEARGTLYREARWLGREVAFLNPRLDFDEILFIKRFTQETYPDVCLNHMPWCSRAGGDLCVFELAGPRAWGSVRRLIDGQLGPGHVHGMDLWFDADRVVFGYAKAKGEEPPPGWLDRRTSFDLRRTVEPTHLFEIGIDGRGLRQLTEGKWSDLDPTYLPSGQVAFVSERCACSLQCNELDKDETSCNLYVMEPDGANIRRLSVTKDGDYLPHTFTDGTIGYTRWEYQERGWAHIQSVWTVRPDGTGADALFKQHMNNPWALEDMRSIPGSKKMAAIATGHHTLAAGPVVILDPHQGMNSPRGIRIVTPGVNPPEGGMSGTPVDEGGVIGSGGFYMTPWPLSETAFIVSGTFGPETDLTGYALYLIDVYGTQELLYRDPAISCSLPIPLVSRPRPAECADVTDASAPRATCMVANVGYGVEGIDPGSIRYLRIAQRLQWPYSNTYGGQRYEPNVKTVMINWTPVRVLGEVPVEADGSAHFVVPVDTPVYFQLLDENHMELRRMRSFVSFQPGEMRACHGCHETRGEAPSCEVTRYPLALARDPSIPKRPPWGDRPLSFLRDVQPVFDEHCVSCHAGLKPAGKLDFSDGLTLNNNRCYDTITAEKLVARSNVGDDAKVTPPLAFGSHKSRLVQVLQKGACGRRARLGEEDWLRLVTWIDANAPYHDGFLNKRPETAPYDLAADRELVAKLAAIHGRRCGGCHEPGEVSRLDWIDLARPRESRFLTAPLASTPAERTRCTQAVYADRNDPDYQAVSELVESAAARAFARPRRDIAALVGPAH